MVLHGGLQSGFFEHALLVYIYKMIRKIILILLSLAVLLSTASCGLIVPVEKHDVHEGITADGYSDTERDKKTTMRSDIETEDPESVRTTEGIIFDEEVLPVFDVSRFSTVEELLDTPPYHDAKVTFCYEDLTTGYTYSYNGDSKMWAASVMKLPYALSLLRKTETEDIGLDDIFVYTGEEYVDGTGVIQNMPHGSAFTYAELIMLSMRYSDNIAQSQLRKKYGTDLYYEYVRSIGADSFTGEWGWEMTAKHGAAVLREAWEYIEGDYRYSAHLKEAMLNTEHKVMLSPGLKGKEFARKYGWDADGYNDAGIVYDEHPYTLVFLSDMTSGDWGVNGYITQVARLVNEAHEKMWGTVDDPSAYTVINTVQEDLLWGAEHEN